MYTLVFAPQALEDLSKLKKSEPAAFKKAGKLLAELQEHPQTGTGKPELLSTGASRGHRTQIRGAGVQEKNGPAPTWCTFAPVMKQKEHLPFFGIGPYGHYDEAHGRKMAP